MRTKGFFQKLVCYDLTSVPYPFADASFDHTISTGVFQFFEDLNPVFREIGRILRSGGIFVFITGYRSPSEEATVILSPGQAGTRTPVTLFRHTEGEVNAWLESGGFDLIDTLTFMIWMDDERSRYFPGNTYLARRR